jgi:hypothetical protein
VEAGSLTEVGEVIEVREVRFPSLVGSILDAGEVVFDGLVMGGVVGILLV